MACGPQDETGEQAVKPTAILQAMQTAIAQELRARCEAPQDLPPRPGCTLGPIEGAAAIGLH